ncbi:THUMP domain-containing class I SAM-dependent RNA methyltransferase [Sporosalibacterium faouarense]|uniref:THUMP domain-containing class I SAM-dependent RNA methyltransferase n=1 Tax=Sporosalibacterium faouarense TaxID=516123 RepID=UPI00141D0590|nr:class I SAM-dependent RNA methyltransferase [Sporosalibacterium faouarense]MTI46432.1 class I SAM-dependent RNA methyltransferase [Bacillota bacterium]
MSTVELIATSTFGLEAVVKREVTDLGFDIISVENGKVTFKSDFSGIAKANLWLRSADRVLLKIGEFKAESFEELFDKTKALPWGEWITQDGEFTVTGKSIKSKLFSVPDCQSIVKKAVVEKLKEKYEVDWFEETGAKYTIQVALLKNIATLTIDTSGEGLHKRGYRETALEAPLKETLAAAMIQLSFWDKNRLLVDPFCGSGTIPIEAAMIGRNMAPGLHRKFASEEWPQIGEKIWKEERVKALKAIRQDVEINIIASDIDKRAIEVAENNAFEAGVDDCIEFKSIDMAKLRLNEKYGVIICNPPYGERLGEKEEVRELYKTMGIKFNKLDTWSKYVITSEEDFEKYYKKKADKKRKLYNGRIKVDYYQYYGPRPPKK